MIFFAVKYVYFLLLLAFVGIIGIASVFGKETISQNIVYIFTILLIPVFEICIENIKKETERFNWSFDGGALLKLFLIFMITLIAYNKGQDPLTLVTLVFFLVGFIFSINPRIAFLISLFCFGYVGVFMLINHSATAEKLSVFAYYYLVIGVILQIKQSIIEKRNNTETIETGES